MDWPRLEYWLADRKQRAGDRVGAARSFLRSSTVIGRPRSISRAAEAFLWPQAQRFRNERWGQRVPAAWRDEVATWLVAETDPVAPSGAAATAAPTPDGAEVRRPDRSGLGAG